MKRYIHKIISVIITLVISCSMCGCDIQNVSATLSDLADMSKSAHPWDDTCIIGNLPNERPRLEDDFYANINWGWLSTNQEVPAGYFKYGVREELDVKNKQNILKVIKNGKGDTHEQELLYTFYNAFIDKEAREEAGLKPIQPYIDEIMAIASIDELSTYLTDGKYRPADMLMNLSILKYPYDTDRFMLVILPSGENLDIIEDDGESVYTGIMQKLGISDEEADTLNNAASDFVCLISENCEDTYDMYAPDLADRYKAYTKIKSMDELKHISQAFPICEILKSKGFDKADYISVPSIQWLGFMNEQYTAENLNAFKGMLIHSIINNTAAYLSSDAKDAASAYYLDNTGAMPSDDIDETLYYALSSLLYVPLGRVYTDSFISDETIADVTEMVEDLRAVLRKRIENAAWLSDETRINALEKLDCMKLNIAKGKKPWDCSSLILSDDDPLAMQAIKILEFNDGLYFGRLGKSAKQYKDYWISGPNDAEFTFGAFYEPEDNSINIKAGTLAEPFYYADGTTEQRYMSIGAIIGHELTHGFDPNGSRFGRNGEIEDWWTQEDRENYDALVENVKGYFSTIEVRPDEFLDVDKQIGEIVGDMGGVSLALEALKERGSDDYDLAFRTHAMLWSEIESGEAASILLENDSHPPKYVRCNATLQQFQQFYDTYNINENDKMYLAPDKRVSVW